MALDPIKRQQLRDENAQKLNTLTENYTGMNLAAEALNFKKVGLQLRKDNMYGNEERQRYHELKKDYTHYDTAGLVHEMEVGNSRLMMVDAGYSEIGENSTKERYRQEPTVLKVSPAEGVSQEFFDKGMDFIKTASKTTHSAPWNSILFAHKSTDMNNAVWQEVLNLAKKPKYANHPFVKELAKLPQGSKTSFVNVETLGGWREQKENKMKYTPQYIAALDMLYGDIRRVNTPDEKGRKDIEHPGVHSAEGKSPIVGIKKSARTLQTITTPDVVNKYGNVVKKGETSKEKRTLYATASQNVRNKAAEEAKTETAKSAAEQKGTEAVTAQKKALIDDYAHKLASLRGIDITQPGMKELVERIAKQGHEAGVLENKQSVESRNAVNQVKQIISDKYDGLGNVTYQTLIKDGLIIQTPSNIDKKARYNMDEKVYTQFVHGQDTQATEGGKKKSSGISTPVGELLDKRGKEIEAENKKRAKYFDPNNPGQATHQVYQAIGGEIARRQAVSKYYTDAIKVISGSKEIQQTIFKRSLADFSGSTDEKKAMIVEGIMSAIRAIGTYDKSKGTSINSRVYTKVSDETGEIKHGKRVVVKSLPNSILQKQIEGKNWDEAYKTANKLAEDMMKEARKVNLASEFSEGGKK